MRTVGVWMAVALGLAASACGSAQTRSVSAPRAPAAPVRHGCLGNDLAAAYAGTEGATGHMELTVSLRNTGQRTCVIKGYPGARLVDARGAALPLRLRRGHGFFPDTTAAPRPVTLRPGASARVGLSFVTNDEYAGARVCRTAVAVLLTPPGWSGRPGTRVALPRAPRIRPCGDRLVVSPVHA